LQNEMLFEPLHNNIKKDKIPQQISLICIVFELSTAVVKVGNVHT